MLSKSGSNTSKYDLFGPGEKQYRNECKSVHVSVGSDDILQFCPITNKNFVAPLMIYENPKNHQQHYWCLICDKQGKGKKAWHPLKMKSTRPKGYDEQALLTVIHEKKGITEYDIDKELKWPKGKARKVAIRLEASGRVRRIPGERNHRAITEVQEIPPKLHDIKWREERYTILKKMAEKGKRISNSQHGSWGDDGYSPRIWGSERFIDKWLQNRYPSWAIIAINRDTWSENTLAMGSTEDQLKEKIEIYKDQWLSQGYYQFQIVRT